MSRFTHSLLALAFLAAVAGCAPLDRAPDSHVSGSVPWSEPQARQPRANPEVEAAARAVAEAEAEAEAAAVQANLLEVEPIILRGTDRMVAPRQQHDNAFNASASTSLRFEAAPAAEVVSVMLRDLLGVDYVVYPPLNGTITLTTRQNVSADRALLLLETALQANGIVMARDARGTYHVGAPEALRGVISAPVLAQPGKPVPPGFGTIIIPLEYLGAGEMAKILEPLVPAEAILRVDNLRNILVMRGTRAEAEGWLDLVATFDVNLLRGMSVAVFPLKYTSAADLEAALSILSGSAEASSREAAQQATTQASTTRVARQRAAAQAAQQAAAPAPAMQGLGEGSPLFGALRIVPIERINAVLVITPRAAYLDEVRYWIEQFDRPNLNSTEPQLFVYKVQNGSSLHLAELLNGIYGGGQEGGGFSGLTGIAPGQAAVSGANTNVNTSFASQFGSQRGSSRNLGGNTRLGSSNLGASGLGNTASLGGVGGFGSFGGSLANPGQQGPNVVTTQLGQSVRVMADQINNTLLIYATPAEYQQIASTLRRLDIQRAQILIEASIVEVTLGDGLEYGLQWAFKGGLGSGRTGTGVIGSAVGGQLGADGSTPAGISNAFTYTLRNAAGDISAVLSALANQSLIKVMSSPSLMVLDNHTAAIQVGTQQPVNTGTTVSGSSNYISTNIQYKDTGVMLGVTPSVSAGDLVTLDIDQIVTDVGPDSASAATAGYPTFMQRQINSKVSVRSGETLVLGGLIKDSTSSGKAGVPGLSAIPVVGALFGRHKSSAERTELLVILTPRVLRSDEDARAVGRELRDRMQGLMQGGALLPATSRDAQP